MSGSKQLPAESLPKSKNPLGSLAEGLQPKEATEQATYMLDQQKRLGEAKLREAKDRKNLLELLTYVIEGEQDRAEALLKKNPELALQKGTVTDLSRREFKETTAFQYALWALDWHMWGMLLKHMPVKEAAMQFQELEEKGTAHGKHFNLAPLIKALGTYAKNCGSWGYVEREGRWRKEVGGNQASLPVHVVNEYCHPSRSFSPCPDFKKEKTLIRTMKLSGNKNWFTCIHNGGKLGSTFGIIRYDWGATAIGGLSWVVKDFVTADAEALQTLWKVRQLQLEALKLELTVISSLDNFLPPALTEIVMSYV